MMYGSWDIERDRQIFFVILDHFLPFYNPNINILKKLSKCLEILSFYTSVPKIMIICYTVPEIQHMMDVNVIFHFGPFFALLQPQKWKFQKKKRKKKTPGDVIILHMCTKNYDQVMYGSWEMVCKGWADGQKKWHIEVGAPPKNKNKKLFEVVQKAMESCFHFKKLYIVLVWLLWMFVKKFFFKQHVSIILWSFSS